MAKKAAAGVGVKSEETKLGTSRDNLLSHMEGDKDNAYAILQVGDCLRKGIDPEVVLKAKEKPAGGAEDGGAETEDDMEVVIVQCYWCGPPKQLFVYKQRPFSSPLWVLIGVLAKFHK